MYNLPAFPDSTRNKFFLQKTHSSYIAEMVWMTSSRLRLPHITGVEMAIWLSCGVSFSEDKLGGTSWWILRRCWFSPLKVLKHLLHWMHWWVRTLVEMADSSTTPPFGWLTVDCYESLDDWISVIIQLGIDNWCNNDTKLKCFSGKGSNSSSTELIFKMSLPAFHRIVSHLCCQPIFFIGKVGTRK